MIYLISKFKILKWWVRHVKNYIQRSAFKDMSQKSNVPVKFYLESKQHVLKVGDNLCGVALELSKNRYKGVRERVASQREEHPHKRCNTSIQMINRASASCGQILQFCKDYAFFNLIALCTQNRTNTREIPLIVACLKLWCLLRKTYYGIKG